MRRHCTAIVAGMLAAACALPAVASAKRMEIGTLADDVRGSCPENCQSVTRSTGYQAKVGPDRELYRAPADGRIVAWTIALGKPGPKQTAYFEERYGGAPQAAVVVLDSGEKLLRTVVAKAPLQRLTDYLGQSVQFPLERTLRVRKGQYIGLTVPTWAPALQVGLGSDTSWRSSRAKTGCVDLTTQFALLGARTAATFNCLYKTARLTYSATLITSAPKPDKPTQR